MNEYDDHLRIRRIERNNKRLNSYMTISLIALLSIFASISLYNVNVLNEEVNKAVISIGSTVVVMDTIYYFVDKLKLSLKRG